MVHLWRWELQLLPGCLRAQCSKSTGRQEALPKDAVLICRWRLCCRRPCRIWWPHCSSAPGLRWGQLTPALTYDYCPPSTAVAVRSSCTLDLRGRLTFDVCLRLRLQGSVAALLSAAHSQQAGQGAEEECPPPDGFGLAGAEQAAAEKAALKAQLAALTQVGFRAPQLSASISLLTAPAVTDVSCTH
jgi:hypothetical protein